MIKFLNLYYINCQTFYTIYLKNKNLFLNEQLKKLTFLHYFHSKKKNKKTLYN